MSVVLRTAVLALLLPPAEPPRNTTHPARRRHDAYAPGPIRAALDRERAAVESFVERHPEYAKLGQEEIVQAMSTYRTAEEHEERHRLRDAGVPRGWRRDRDEVEELHFDDDSRGRVG